MKISELNIVFRAAILERVFFKQVTSSTEVTHPTMERPQMWDLSLILFAVCAL